MELVFWIFNTCQFSYGILDKIDKSCSNIFRLLSSDFFGWFQILDFRIPVGCTQMKKPGPSATLELAFYCGTFFHRPMGTLILFEIVCDFIFELSLLLAGPEIQSCFCCCCCCCSSSSSSSCCLLLVACDTCRASHMEL